MWFWHFIGYIFVLGGILHAWRWRRKNSDGDTFTGIIVDRVYSDDYYTVVECQWNGETIRFKSRYSGGGTIGRPVRVIRFAKSGDFEVYSRQNVWLFTLLPILFGMLFIATSLLP